MLAKNLILIYSNPNKSPFYIMPLNILIKHLTTYWKTKTLKNKIVQGKNAKIA